MRFAASLTARMATIRRITLGPMLWTDSKFGSQHLNFFMFLQLWALMLGFAFEMGKDNGIVG